MWHGRKQQESGIALPQGISHFLVSLMEVRPSSQASLQRDSDEAQGTSPLPLVTDLKVTSNRKPQFSSQSKTRRPL